MDFRPLSQVRFGRRRLYITLCNIPSSGAEGLRCLKLLRQSRRPLRSQLNSQELSSSLLAQRKLCMDPAERSWVNGCCEENVRKFGSDLVCGSCSDSNFNWPQT